MSTPFLFFSLFFWLLCRPPPLGENASLTASACRIEDRQCERTGSVRVAYTDRLAFEQAYEVAGSFLTKADILL